MRKSSALAKCWKAIRFNESSTYCQLLCVQPQHDSVCSRLWIQNIVILFRNSDSFFRDVEWFIVPLYIHYTFEVQNISLRFCYTPGALSTGNARQAHISQQQICYSFLKGPYLTSGAAWSLTNYIRTSGCISFDVGRSGLWRQTVSLAGGGGGLCTGKHVEPILGNSLVRLEAHHSVPGKVYKRNLSM